MHDLKLLSDTLLRAEERFLQTLDEMTLAQANTMPRPIIKSVTWLVWHTSRMIDYQVPPLAGEAQLWFSQGWKEKFALDLPDDTQDWRHTPEEAAKVVVADKQLLIDYLQATVAYVVHYLRHLPQDTLEEIIDRSWTPPVTRGVRLVSTVDDAVMHSGQAVYTKRLLLNRT